MKAYSITDVGQVRKVNQDYVFCYPNSVGQLPNLFLVADGMGGHQAGDYASRCCVETIATNVKNSQVRSPIGILENAIQEANRTVFCQAEADASLHGMGTTIVAVTILGEELYVANIGDSRAYLLREEMHQITEDHSWVEEMVRNGELERKDARHHKNKNAILIGIYRQSFWKIDFN